MNAPRKTPRNTTKRTLSFLGKRLVLDSIPDGETKKPTACRVSGPYYDANVGTYRLVVFEGETRKTIRAKSEAEALRLKAQIERTFQQVERSIDDAIVEFLEDKRRQGIKELSISAVEEKLRSLLPVEQLLSSLTQERAQQLYTAATQRISRYGTPLRVQTHYSYLKVSRHFFRWAVEQKYIPANPFEKVKRIGKPDVGKKQLRIDESRRMTQVLVDACTKGQEGAIATLCQMLLGLRSREVLLREVRDLDDEGKILWIPSGKTKNARRRLEVPEVLRPYLLRMVEGKAPERLIFEGRNQKPHGIPWLWKQVTRYCKEANLPRVCPHSLRGLHASLAMAAGCTSNAVASALGHGSFAITAKHYVDPDTLHNSTLRRFSSSLTTAGHADEDLSQLLDRLRALPAETLSALLRSIAAQTAN